MLGSLATIPPHEDKEASQTHPVSFRHEPVASGSIRKGHQTLTSLQTPSSGVTRISAA